MIINYNVLSDKSLYVIIINTFIIYLTTTLQDYSKLFAALLRESSLYLV